MQTLEARLANVEEMLIETLSLLKGKSINRTWVRQPEFMTITGKKRHQVEYIRNEHPELWRKRKGEGVQINLKEYNRIYN